MTFCRAGGLGLICLFMASALSCSFDYDLEDDADLGTPDLTMRNIEYVRVRDGHPVARLQAESAERWEEHNTMAFSELRFAQYDQDGSSDAVGEASRAVVDVGSGDADLTGSVLLVVPGEELSIETSALSWRADARELYGPNDDQVVLKKSDGSVVRGEGFRADARSRSWNFRGEVSGLYVEEDSEK